LSDGRGAGGVELTPLDFITKPNSITLASWELAPNMFGASSEPASIMEFGTN